MRVALVAVACLALAGMQAQSSLEIQFRTAREALRGQTKDPDTARKILLKLVQSGALDGNPQPLSYACVYLGYIEDRAHHREEAVEWFRKALAVEGGDPGILEVAKEGLTQPITWIRHLDETSPAPAQQRPANPYVTAQPPAGLNLATQLSEQQRRANFENLWNAIDTTYAHFKLKSIDWKEVGNRYRKRLDTVQTAPRFYSLLFELVNELKDTHSWLQSYQPPGTAGVPELSIDLFEDRPYVVAVEPGSEPAGRGIQPGWEVVSVDGLTVAEKMEALRPRLHACSSERAYRREAARSLLIGDIDRAVTVTFRSPEGAKVTLALGRAPGRSARPPDRSPGFDLTRQRFFITGATPPD